MVLDVPFEEMEDAIVKGNIYKNLLPPLTISEPLFHRVRLIKLPLLVDPILFLETFHRQVSQGR